MPDINEANEQMVVLVPVHQLHHNYGKKFTTTNRICPVSGEFLLEAHKVILEPGKCCEVPKGLADEFFAIAAKQEAVGAPPCVRLPDERELLSFRHARGDFSTAN